MKRLNLFCIILLFCHITLAQPAANYDKTLNEAELAYLNKLFADSVRFNGKIVCFVYQNYQFFITNKHHFFNNESKKIPMIYRLLHLDESEKRQSGGYDIIVVYQINEGKKPKDNKPGRVLVVEAIGRRQYYHTQELAIRYYPDDLSHLGIDSSATLTAAETDYLNKVFRYEYKDIDFTNKKIAFFTGLAGDRLKTKMDYFNYRKRALSEVWYQGRGTLLALNEQQRQESGVDYIILYMSKLYTMDKMMAIVTGKPYFKK
jgi:hypothetical protein